MDLIEFPAVVDHKMDRIINGDAKSDRGNHGSANIERYAEKAHQTEIQNNRSNIGEEGYESGLDRHEQSGMDNADNEEGLPEAGNLIQGHVIRRVVNQDPFAGKLSFQILGEVLLDIGLALVKELTELRRAREVMAHSDIKGRVVMIHILGQVRPLYSYQVLGHLLRRIRDNLKLRVALVHLPAHHTHIVRERDRVVYFSCSLEIILQFYHMA